MERMRARRTIWSAWGLSVAVHLAAAVVLTLLWSSVHRPRASRHMYHDSLYVVTLSRNVFAQDGRVAMFGWRSDRAQTDIAAGADHTEQGSELLQSVWSGLSGAPLPVHADNLPQLPSGTSEEHFAPKWNVIAAPSGAPRRDLRSSDELLTTLLAQHQVAPTADTPVGQPATVRLFDTIGATGRSFVFVLDRSGSTGPGSFHVLTEASRQLVRAMNALSEQQRVGIIAYNDRLTYLENGQLVPVSAELLRKAEEFLHGVVAFGPTDHTLALHAALDLKPEVVFLLTDGDDPVLTPREIRDISSRARRNGTRIFCIQFGRGSSSASSFLQALAISTGGEYAYVDATR